MDDNAGAEVTTRPEPAGPGLVELLVALGRHRRTLLLVPLAAAAVAAAVSLVLPQWFTATARILPPQQGQSTAAAMLSQLGGGLSGLAGGALGIKNPTDLYVGMLRSDTVADALVARFELKKVYGEETLMEARKALREHVRFSGDKSGIIAIEAEARTPALAADLANACIEELHKLTSTLAVTEAAQRRVFFERQLQQTKEKLADAEVKLRQAMEQGGLVSVDVQGRVAVETVARLRAQISVKEVQIGAMRAYATPSNPDMMRAEQEVAALRRELARMESGGKGEGGDGSQPAGPSGVGNIRLLREVKYHEVMFELMAKQFELARVDESKEAPIVQVMDRASPPEKRSSPKRSLIVVLTWLTALFGVVAACLARDAAAHPGRRERLAALREAWMRGGPAR